MKSRSQGELPSTSTQKEKKKSQIPLPRRASIRNLKVDSQQPVGLELEQKTKRNSKHSINLNHKQNNIDINYKNNNSEPSSSLSNNSSEIGKKHKFKKHRKSSSSPSSSRIKLEETTEEDKIHKSEKYTLSTNKIDNSLKEKSKKLEKHKHKGNSNFNLKVNHSVSGDDNSEASTSSANLTYPQVIIYLKIRVCLLGLIIKRKINTYIYICEYNL